MPTKKVKSVWEVLSKHPVTEKIEKKWYKDKSGKPYSLSYLSWAWAWGEVKKFYPKQPIQSMRILSIQTIL